MNTAYTGSRASAYKKSGSLENERQKRSFLAALAMAFLLFGGSIWTAIEAVSGFDRIAHAGCGRGEHVGGRELCGADSAGVVLQPCDSS